MSLVQCPECGRDNVSDSAEICPSCGFGIKEYYEEAKKAIEIEQKKQLEYDSLINSIKMPGKPYEPQKTNTQKLSFYRILCIVVFVIGIIIFFAFSKGMGLYDNFLSFSGIVISTGGVIGIIIISVNLKELEKKYKCEKSKYYVNLNDYNDAKKDFETYRKNKVEQKLKQDREMKEWIDRMDKWQAYKDSQSLKCPKCGSSNVGTGARGYNIITGFVGSNKTVNRCGKCGYMWKPK